VDVVYDSVGQATFMQSLDCLRPMGMMVSFGQSSGSVPPLDLGELAARGSLFLTRPSLMVYTAARADLLNHAGDLFEVVQNGAVKIEVNQTYPLAEAARAHRDLEARKTTGSTILIPGD
jgi:NADPH2:quinone reductase